VTGDSDPDKPFNRPAARNAAARAAGNVDVYLFIDADAVLPYDQLLAAIALARQTGDAVLPYERHVAVWLDGTRAVLQAPGMDGFSPTGNIVVPASLFRHLPWDERFAGWGFEDIAYCMRADTIGTLRTVPGDIELFEHERTPSEERKPVLDVPAELLYPYVYAWEARRRSPVG
jgi:glycosyltransferase involved in cell wall biosynthesis